MTITDDNQKLINELRKNLGKALIDQRKAEQKSPQPVPLDKAIIYETLDHLKKDQDIGSDIETQIKEYEKFKKKIEVIDHVRLNKLIADIDEFQTYCNELIGMISYIESEIKAVSGNPATLKLAFQYNDDKEDYNLYRKIIVAFKKIEELRNKISHLGNKINHDDYILKLNKSFKDNYLKTILSLLNYFKILAKLLT